VDEIAFRDVISGRRHGLPAALVRCGLSGLAIPYKTAVSVRNWCYDHGWKRTFAVHVPIVSVGNLTAGRTGKTRVVSFLAHWFQTRGVRVGIVSRGYRADCEQGNDEKRVLDQLCPGVPHIQQGNRVAAATAACRQHACQLLILDDGFQHRRLRRDLDILLIDASNPWGFGHLLPRGLLREPIASLKRADLVVLTRVNQCSPAQKQSLTTQLERHGRLDCCIEVVFRPDRLVSSAGETQPPDRFTGRSVIAFCGIGNPEAFHQTLQQIEFDVREFIAFSDHHKYSDQDLKLLDDHATQVDAEALITTQKDLVKLDRTHLGQHPLWFLHTVPDVVRGADVLEQHLTRLLPGRDPAAGPTR